MVHRALPADPRGSNGAASATLIGPARCCVARVFMLALADQADRATVDCGFALWARPSHLAGHARTAFFLKKGGFPGKFPGNRSAGKLRRGGAMHAGKDCV